MKSFPKIALMSATSFPADLYGHFRPRFYWETCNVHPAPKLHDVVLHLSKPLNAQYDVEELYLDDFVDPEEIQYSDISFAISMFEESRDNWGKIVPIKPTLSTPVLLVIFPILERCV
jgi:hypothetical protein